MRNSPAATVQCPPNLAQHVTLAGVVAPLFALIPGLGFLGYLSAPVSALNIIQYAGLIVLAAYAFTWLLAIPILLATRRRVVWTPLGVIIFGAVLGAAAWFIPILWGFAHDIATWGLAGAWSRLLGYEWFPVPWFGACGLVVAAAFAAIQYVRLQRSRGP